MSTPYRLIVDDFGDLITVWLSAPNWINTIGQRGH